MSGEWRSGIRGENDWFCVAQLRAAVGSSPESWRAFTAALPARMQQAKQTMEALQAARPPAPVVVPPKNQVRAWLAEIGIGLTDAQVEAAVSYVQEEGRGVVDLYEMEADDFEDMVEEMELEDADVEENFRKAVQSLAVG